MTLFAAARRAVGYRCSGATHVIGLCIDTSIQSVFFVSGTGGKEQRVDRLAGEAVAERDPPQSIDFDRMAVHAFQLTQEFARRKIERVDSAIAEIADK